MHLTLLDPADDDAVDELHAFDLRRWPLDEPTDPPPLRSETLVDAARSYVPGRREVWLAHADGRLAGTARLTFFSHDNTHAADVSVEVAPDLRRRGLGTALLQHATERARAQGRRLALFEIFDGSPAERFLAARGATQALVDVRRRLHLDAVTPATHERQLAEARRHAADYELLAWSGPAPEELVDPAAGVLMSMNDAPLDDLDYEDERWDATRLRALEEYRALLRWPWHTVVARHRATGALAGLTEVEVRGTGSTLAYQGYTVVVPAHRGHRLGLVLKLEMLRQLRELEPAVRCVDTWNAASNPHMIAINEALGFEVLHTESEWQLDLRR